MCSEVNTASNIPYENMPPSSDHASGSHGRSNRHGSEQQQEQTMLSDKGSFLRTLTFNLGLLMCVLGTVAFLWGMASDQWMIYSRGNVKNRRLPATMLANFGPWQACTHDGKCGPPWEIVPGLDKDPVRMTQATFAVASVLHAIGVLLFVLHPVLRHGHLLCSDSESSTEGNWLRRACRRFCYWCRYYCCCSGDTVRPGRPAAAWMKRVVEMILPEMVLPIAVVLGFLAMLLTGQLKRGVVLKGHQEETAGPGFFVCLASHVISVAGITCVVFNRYVESHYARMAKYILPRLRRRGNRRKRRNTSEIEPEGGTGAFENARLELKMPQTEQPGGGDTGNVQDRTPVVFFQEGADGDCLDDVFTDPEPTDRVVEDQERVLQSDDGVDAVWVETEKSRAGAHTERSGVLHNDRSVEVDCEQKSRGVVSEGGAMALSEESNYDSAESHQRNGNENGSDKTKYHDKKSPENLLPQRAKGQTDSVHVHNQPTSPRGSTKSSKAEEEAKERVLQNPKQLSPGSDPVIDEPLTIEQVVEAGRGEFPNTQESSTNGDISLAFPLSAPEPVDPVVKPQTIEQLVEARKARSSASKAGPKGNSSIARPRPPREDPALKPLTIEQLVETRMGRPSAPENRPVGDSPVSLPAPPKQSRRRRRPTEKEVQARMASNSDSAK